MADFKRRVLAVLDRIYNIVGDTAPNALQTELPVSMVHDISREAELGAGIGPNGGFLALETVLTNSGAPDQVYQQIAPHEYILNTITPSFIASQGLRAEGIDVWLLGWGAEHPKTDDALTSLAIALGYVGASGGPGYPYSQTGAWQPIAWADTENLFSNQAGDDDVLIPYEVAPAVCNLARPIYIPYLGPFGSASYSQVIIRADAAGDLTLYVWIYVWAGPKGVPPPGLR